MSKTVNGKETNGTDNKPTEVKTDWGLVVRVFDGKIEEKKDNSGKVTKPEVPYKYPRVLVPYMRASESRGTGTSEEDQVLKKVEGKYPNYKMVVDYIQSLGFSTEYEFDDKGNLMSENCVTSFLLEGLNKYLNSNARSKAENTAEALWERIIAMVMKSQSIDREAAEKLYPRPAGV